ncbi:unnamed protein product [Arabis nemorensis]|uniref:Uncharacterized protein n=1 Tax=Arabis nemorensis TaxID=586526 RepID=A0A565BLK5_9BRAS|nr:unnamed protein product [Arabis nemorensis]
MELGIETIKIRVLIRVIAYEDEKAVGYISVSLLDSELEGQSLFASSQFDIFGFTATEQSHKQAEKDQHERLFVRFELATKLPSIYFMLRVKLLLQMGWRRGHSIKDVRASSSLVLNLV